MFGFNKACMAHTLKIQAMFFGGFFCIFFIGLKKLAEQNQIFHFLKINCHFRFL